MKLYYYEKSRAALLKDNDQGDFQRPKCSVLEEKNSKE